MQRTATIQGNYTKYVTATVCPETLYAACQTRPDIQYHVSHLAQFMQDPSLEAYEAAIGVLCYLYRTKDARPAWPFISPIVLVTMAGLLYVVRLPLGR